MKTIEEAYQDIAVFMYGLNWWKNKELKDEIFSKKKFESFLELEKVWQKMSDNYKEKGTLFTTSKTKIEIFGDVVDDLYQYSFSDGEWNLIQMVMVSTSEKLKTLNK